MEDISAVSVAELIDSMNEGVYVCDPERRITYWSRSAERITGWRAEEVVGRHCFDSVLCHVDKDGHQLCGKEHCPLHRSIVTGTSSDGSLLVFAQSRSGERVPMHVSVAPIRDSADNVIGGVETFRDASREIHDLRKAKALQRLALEQDLPDDPRIRFTTHYVPHDIVGGDYYAIHQLDDDRYGFVLADVTGHGVAAALYTMHLSQLWDRYRDETATPGEFARRVNNELVSVFKSDSSFATAVCGLVDLKQGELRFAGAGGPPVIHFRCDGRASSLESPGFPLAVVEDAEFDEVVTPIGPGDRVLLFSDGAMEVIDASGAQLGVDGLLAALAALDYPERDLCMEALEEALLRFSNDIRLPDDLTLMEIRIDQA